MFRGAKPLTQTDFEVILVWTVKKKKKKGTK